MSQVANVRLHGDTGKTPDELSSLETLQPLNPNPYDLGTLHSLRSSRVCRVHFDSNSYSVPATHARQVLHMEAYTDRVLVLDGQRAIAAHRRSYGRGQDFELPGHMDTLSAKRLRIHQQRQLVRFLQLGPAAPACWDGLQERRPDAMVQVLRIVALAELHGDEMVCQSLRICWVYSPSAPTTSPT
jgi:hypothetical protein